MSGGYAYDLGIVPRIVIGIPVIHFHIASTPGIVCYISLAIACVLVVVHVHKNISCRCTLVYTPVPIVECVCVRIQPSLHCSRAERATSDGCTVVVYADLLCGHPPDIPHYYLVVGAIELACDRLQFIVPDHSIFDAAVGGPVE